MKPRSIILAVGSLATIALFSLAGETNKTAKFDPFPTPIVGMSITDLVRCMEEIKSQIPVGPKIIGMRIQDENHVIVETGKKTGPLAGGGTWIFFEKTEGKWKKMKETSWVS